MIQKTIHLDWSILRGSALLSIGTIISRILGILFSFILAMFFLPEEYGYIQYNITIAALIAVLTQPFSQHVMARFIGKYSYDKEKTHKIVMNMYFIHIILFILTIFITIPILILSNRFNIGVFIIFIGQMFFYIYWGLSLGFSEPHKLTIVYLSSNAIQLILLTIIFYIFKTSSSFIVLSIYGLSYLLPIVFMQLSRPFVIEFKIHYISKELITEILRFSLPIWFSHAAYILYSTISLLMLEAYSKQMDLGIYSVTYTLCQGFVLIPTSVAMIIMPKIAGSSERGNLYLLKSNLIISLLINVIIFIVYMFVIKSVITYLFGTSYVADSATYAILALAMIIFGIHSIITAFIVGSGRPRDETISRLVCLIITFLIGWLYIPAAGALGASIAMLAGMLGAIATYAVILVIKAQPKAFTKAQNPSE